MRSDSERVSLKFPSLVKGKQGLDWAEEKGLSSECENKKWGLGFRVLEIGFEERGNKERFAKECAKTERGRRCLSFEAVSFLTIISLDYFLVFRSLVIVRINSDFGGCYAVLKHMEYSYNHIH